jgi:hypothetical protein
VSTVHVFKPLPEIFRPFGKFSSMYSTVVPGLLSVTSKLRPVFFGLAFVRPLCRIEHRARWKFR